MRLRPPLPSNTLAFDDAARAVLLFPKTKRRSGLSFGLNEREDFVKIFEFLVSKMPADAVGGADAFGAGANAALSRSLRDFLVASKDAGCCC